VAICLKNIAITAFQPPETFSILVIDGRIVGSAPFLFQRFIYEDLLNEDYPCSTGAYDITFPEASKIELSVVWLNSDSS